MSVKIVATVNFMSKMINNIRDKTHIELLTINEASKLLKVSRRTLYNYIKSGKLPCIKLSNRALRFKETDIMRIISENTILYEPDERVEMIAKKVIEKILCRG